MKYESMDNNPYFRKANELKGLDNSKAKLSSKYNSLYEKLNTISKNFDKNEIIEIESELKRINQSINEIDLLMNTLYDEIDVLAKKFGLG